MARIDLQDWLRGRSHLPGARQASGEPHTCKMEGCSYAGFDGEAEGRAASGFITVVLPSHSRAGAPDCTPLYELGRRYALIEKRVRRRRGVADPIIFPGTVDWSAENPG